MFLLAETTEAGPACINTIKDDSVVINLKHNEQQQRNHDYKTSHYWSRPPTRHEFAGFGIIVTFENISPPGLFWHSLSAHNKQHYFLTYRNIIEERYS